MTTPICDFVSSYVADEPIRLHMPGHKGIPVLGLESLDITEISGADVLYKANGIIAESRENARNIFGTRATFYSTEGSSHCIRAMINLAMRYAKANGRAPNILAARNVHKTFLYAVGLSDISVRWLYPRTQSDILSCPISATEVDAAICAMEAPPVAVYLTSPDYLGNIADIKQIAAVCHKHDTLLLVDNAHGAYLHFLPESKHPMALGADLCCDSAHKTLPALTGTAYLHVGKSAPAFLAEEAEDALSLFASTSPSYLLLQSLDRLNPYLHTAFRQELAMFLENACTLREKLVANEYTLIGNEPLKWTILAKAYGYTGVQLAAQLQQQNIVCEFFDEDYLVLMLSPALTSAQLARVCDALCAIAKRNAVYAPPPPIVQAERVCSIREALFSPSSTRRVADAMGHILADASVSCPPAIPILVCGERITEEAIRAMHYYHIEFCKTLDA